MIKSYFILIVYWFFFFFFKFLIAFNIIDSESKSNIIVGKGHKITNTFYSIIGGLNNEVQTTGGFALVILFLFYFILFLFCLNFVYSPNQKYLTIKIYSNHQFDILI